MKKFIILAVTLVFTFTIPALACNKPTCQNGSIHHNNINSNNIDESVTNINRPEANASANALGLGVGISANKNTNKNNINVNNKLKNDIDVNTKIKNDINTKIKNHVDNTDVNLNKVNTTDINKVNTTDVNLVGQRQGMTQGQEMGQGQEANNEGVSTNVVVEGDTVEGSEYKSYYIAPPATTPMIGTTSAQVTSLFGGVGFSKDAKHAQYMTLIEFIGKMQKAGIISEAEAINDSRNVYDKLLNVLCGRHCTANRLKVEKAEEDKEITGNGGNL